MMFFWPINFFVACNKFKLPCYVIKGRSRTTTRSDWNEAGRVNYAAKQSFVRCVLLSIVCYEQATVWQYAYIRNTTQTMNGVSNRFCASAMRPELGIIIRTVLHIQISSNCIVYARVERNNRSGHNGRRCKAIGDCSSSFHVPVVGASHEGVMMNWFAISISLASLSCHDLTRLCGFVIWRSIVKIYTTLTAVPQSTRPSTPCTCQIL